MAKAVPLKNIFFSTWFLYLIVFVVFFNLVGHALNDNYMITLVFILISFITSFFTKNMVVILTLGISLANILFYGTSPIRRLEGFASGSGGEAADKDGPAPYVDEDEVDSTKKGSSAKSPKDFALADSASGSSTIKGKMDDINNLKQKVQDLRNGLPKNADGIKLKPEEAAFMKDKYSDLLKLQDEILGNIGSLEKSMKHVTTIVDDVKKNIDGVKENMSNRK